MRHETSGELKNAQWGRRLRLARLEWERANDSRMTQAKLAKLLEGIGVRVKQQSVQRWLAGAASNGDAAAVRHSGQENLPAVY